MKSRIREIAEELGQRDPGMDVGVLRRADFFDDPDLPLCVFRMPYKFNVGYRAEHTHEFDEMLIITGGNAIHQYDGQEIPMKRGDVFLIPQGLAHGYTMPEGCRLENINLLFDFAAFNIDWGDLAGLEGFQALFEPILEAKKSESIPAFPPPLHLSPDMLALVSRLVNSIEMEVAKEVAGYRFFAKQYFAKLVGILSRMGTHVPLQEGRNSEVFLGLITHLEQNLGEKITVKDMADFEGISESNLRKKFQAVYAESPLHYLQRIRIERSMEMLADPELSVTDIAYEVGMGDSNYYSRIFRQLNHCSPSEYREKLKQDMPSQLLRT